MYYMLDCCMKGSALRRRDLNRGDQFYSPPTLFLIFDFCHCSRHLDDPVIEYVELSKPSVDHTLDDLPMGRYIVCGEALDNAKLLQASCFEARVERLDNNCKNIENISRL